MTSQFSDHTVDSRVHVNAISVLFSVDVIYSIGMNRHTHTAGVVYYIILYMYRMIE